MSDAPLTDRELRHLDPGMGRSDSLPIGIKVSDLRRLVAEVRRLRDLLDEERAERRRVIDADVRKDRAP